MAAVEVLKKRTGILVEIKYDGEDDGSVVGELKKNPRETPFVVPE
jgi:hypothetical protein